MGGSSAPAAKGIAQKEKLLGVIPAGVRDTAGPLFLLCVPPFFVVAFWHTLVNLDGSFAKLGSEMWESGSLFKYFLDICPSPVDPAAWKLILGFAAFEIALMRLLPGNMVSCNATATGHVPVYKANGLLAYVVSLAALFGFEWAGVFNPSDVYDSLGEIVAGLSLFSLVFCLALYFKGLYVPSTEDSGSKGGFVRDYFWGTELYPRVLGVDVKMFTNCRFGMMYWAVGIVCYAYKQMEMQGDLSNSMAVSIFLQLVYVAKFFHWEMGYMKSMDIQHDRAGYYICWGCLVWVPTVYASPSLYLVNHPVALSPAAALAVTALGLGCILANYDADAQRAHFRQVGGKCEIWGRPAEYITAKYTNEKGNTSTSLLLCSGWWGLSRHFHYIPEVLAAFCWSCPGLFERFEPANFFYVIFLTPLLLDRAFRDDARCFGKYGQYWVKYRARVPYKVIPGIL